MANKIYDFLPAHLRNKDLEEIFDATLERVFSKGNLEKTRAYLGRREKGLNNDDDTYLNFPEHLFNRDNYGFEPVFTNDNIKDRVFYDDLLNAMFNKGMLVNDHRRLFESKHKTINLPIDADKFVNWQLYYWVRPQPLYYHVLDENGFGEKTETGKPLLKPAYDLDGNRLYVNFKGFSMPSNKKPEYITIANGADNYWSGTNSWEHIDDIKNLMSNSSEITKIDISEYTVSGTYDPSLIYYIKNDNTELFKQAQRPIIEFDSRLEISSDVTDDTWRIPTFNLYDADGELLEGNFTIFEYVQDELFTPDPILGIDVKTISGDYQSEFVFQITMPDNSLYKLNDELNELYIETEFNYRNLRREFGNDSFEVLELPQAPISENDVDVYVNGIIQNSNYSVEDNFVTFNEEVSGDVYVDLCTKNPVVVDGDQIWQRIDPLVEFNIDNETHNLKEFTYSVFYEHFLRQIETTKGLVGEANAYNNYRTLGQNLNKTQFNKYGSVMVIHDTDVTKGYFAITRDDFDPFKSLEFLAGAYSSYKNRLILKVQELLKEDLYNSKSDLEILESAITELSFTKRENIDTFTGTEMVLFGERYNNYVEGKLDINLGSFKHFLPSDFPLTDNMLEENIMLLVNGEAMKLKNDYVLSDGGDEIIFTNYMVKPGDDVVVRYYNNIAHTFIPPSSTSLDISPLYVPELIVDNEYTNPVTFIKGHDGSFTPAWEKVINEDTGELEENRITKVLLMFETLVYNRNTNKSTIKKNRYLEINASYTSEYTFAEKRYAMYPYFKKWMIKNNINDTRNTEYNINDWKTWNYRALSDDIPGSYRSILRYVYGTEFILSEPWLVLEQTDRPKEELFGWVRDSRYDYTHDGLPVEGGYFEDVDFTSIDFWNNLQQRANANWPIPVDSNGKIKPVTELFNLTIDDENILRQDWEFGDGSPEELAWVRNSEYPFIEFLTKLTLKPFKLLDEYDKQITEIVDFYNRREGFNAKSIVSERSQYKFKLGSKLGGFVNNFKMFSERNSFSNTSKSEIPSDNYDLFVHAGEPNRSESYSAIIIEKVSLDAQYPNYSISKLDEYQYGDIVLRQSDNKYYKRKVETKTQNELDKLSEPSYFDYSAWVLVSQPKVKKFGYRISGYDDFNPVFYTLDWDKTSGEKSWSSDGDLAQLKIWNPGEYYRNDFYVVYNDKPYISLDGHQASESFDEDLRDGKWKLVKTWPKVNTVDAYGYKDVLPDQLKIHNYGDILENVNDIAQLFVGYQEYLKLVGWDFKDKDEFSEVVDFEHMLIKFLDWSRESHQVGEYVILTPIIKSGSFDAPYGIASVGKNANKNYYRVVDIDGRQLNDNMIKFNTDSDGLHWESNVPVYGMKIDIQDIEHAFVVDREDSYGDIIYDPLSHNRNLRILIDCNRSADWDGTLSVDGFIAMGGDLLPNLETMVEETRYYRDTLVDQSLEITNKLKESQLGFAPKMYLTNHFIDRETQLEFHKGFLAGKGTKSSTNRIINKKSNFTDVEHDEIWAFKLDDYGKINNRSTISKTYLSTEINSDPFKIEWDENNKFKMVSERSYRNVPIKTSGYVNPDDVNYVVRNNQILESTVRDTFYEGDTAWIRFDDEREWDVKRLSEIAEISYIGETEDGQLYLGLTNEIDIVDPVFLKIKSVEIDPDVNGYFNLVDDGSKIHNGQTIYEYLVFDNDYEPFIVEIDEGTDNSVYIPTATDSGVEAIGSVSNPTFNDGDRIVINGENIEFDADGIQSSYGLVIGGETATTDPFVTKGEEARIVVYDENNFQLNPVTNITFTGTTLKCVNQVKDVQAGDKININGVDVTITYSDTRTLDVTSTIDTSTAITSGMKMTISNDSGVSVEVESRDIKIEGTKTNPTLSSTQTLRVNNIDIDFNVPGPVTGNDSIEFFNGETAPVTSLILTNNMTNFEPGVVTVNDGVDTYDLLRDIDYTYNSSTKTITFNTPIQGGLFDDDADSLTPDIRKTTVDISVELVAQPVPQFLDMSDIISIINSKSSETDIVASSSNGKLVIDTTVSSLTLRGSVLTELGLSTSSPLQTSKLEVISNQIDNISFMDSSAPFGNKLSMLASDTETLEISGELAFDIFGFSDLKLESTTNPTAFSIARDINNANISGVSAESISGLLEIKFNGAELEVTEVTAGILENIGINSSDIKNSKVNKKCIDSIIDDINSILPSGTVAENYLETDRLVIRTTAKRVELINYLGNPWDDFGIPTGIITNRNTQVTSLQLFKDQINDNIDGVTVSISSDGRMIFTSSGTGIGFGGTPTAILERIGLYENYSSIKSNANFKIMRWKSVRYTPNYIYSSFDDFITDLGFNSYSKIWADEYDDSGWAVLEYSTMSGNPEPIAMQAKQTVDMNDIKRMVVKDGETFSIYQLYDPLNYKLPGSIVKDIDYVDWQDPAKYDDEYSNNLWLSEHVGEIWWDTKDTRYYRYNDYGDAQGKIDVNYVKRFWGKTVPGSTVNIRQWKSASAVPEDIKWFNTETKWDTEANVRKTVYYFWSTVGIDVEDKEYTIDEIKMLIQSGGVTNKFIPVDDKTVIVSNNSNFNSNEIEYTVYKQNSYDLETKHTDWDLVSRKGSKSVDISYMNKLRDSLVGHEVELVSTVVAEKIPNDQDETIFEDEKFVELSFKNAVVSINNVFVEPINIDFPESGKIKISGITIYDSDEVRFYKLSPTTSWFKNLNDARDNFATMVNDHMKRKVLVKEIPYYDEYIGFGTGIFDKENWAISSNFDTIKRYEYLSKTRNFDMIKMFNDGVGSFKIDITDEAEYYFKFGSNLRMVHKENATLKISYPDYIVNNESDMSNYYDNIVSVQTFELINMLYMFADKTFIKNMFFDMIDYMYTEKTYPDWIFKTSYIDLFMMNKSLRQYAIYQNDNYNDIIDYVNETKPYHTKIRKTDRVYPYGELVDSDIDINEAMEIELYFGGHSRYKDNIIDAGDVSDTNWRKTENLGEISSSVEKYFEDEGKYMFTGLDDYTLDSKMPAGLRNLYTMYSENKDLIQWYRNNPNHKFDKGDPNKAIIDTWEAEVKKYMLDPNNDYDAGFFLRRFNTLTNEPGGYDTGEFGARVTEAMVVTHRDKDDSAPQPVHKIDIYDYFGNSYMFESDKINSVVYAGFVKRILLHTTEDLRQNDLLNDIHVIDSNSKLVFVNNVEHVYTEINENTGDEVSFKYEFEVYSNDDTLTFRNVITETDVPTISIEEINKQRIFVTNSDVAQAKDNTVHIVLIENVTEIKKIDDNGEEFIDRYDYNNEFITYNHNDKNRNNESVMYVNNSGLFTGISHNYNFGDSIYTLKQRATNNYYTIQE